MSESTSSGRSSNAGSASISSAASTRHDVSRRNLTDRTSARRRRHHARQVQEPPHTGAHEERTEEEEQDLRADPAVPQAHDELTEDVLPPEQTGPQREDREEDPRDAVDPESPLLLSESGPFTEPMP